jgi:very-short-patch-repair endonuclease
MKYTNNHYNKELKALAREKRKTGTKSEIVIWKELLNNKKTGFKFLRQRPIDNYIVDFCCKELNLIIEIDGYSHTLEEVKLNDTIRENILIEKGYSILRFSDKEIMGNIYNVKRAIISFIIENNIKGHLPNPPQGGNIKRQNNE